MDRFFLFVSLAGGRACRGARDLPRGTADFVFARRPEGRRYSSLTMTRWDWTFATPAGFTALMTTSLGPTLFKFTSFLKWPFDSTSTSSLLMNTVAPASVTPSN